MADLHKNFAYSLVATAPSPATSGTSLVVTAGQGSRFPTPPFNATIWPAGSNPTPSNAEIVTVTAIATDTLTIVRAAESTTARTVIVGDQIANTITNKTLLDAEPANLLVYQNIPQIGLTRLVQATRHSKVPIFIPFAMTGSMSQMRSISFLAERSSGTSLNVTAAVAFYSANNSTQLGLISSESFAISLTTSAQYSGIRAYEISLTSISALKLTAGNYWLGLYMNGSGDSSSLMQINWYGVSTNALNGYVQKGTNNTVATANTLQIYPMAGSYSATLATNTPFPSTVGKSQISGAGSNDAPLLYFQIIA